MWPRHIFIWLYHYHLTANVSKARLSGASGAYCRVSSFPTSQQQPRLTLPETTMYTTMAFITIVILQLTMLLGVAHADKVFVPCHRPHVRPIQPGRAPGTHHLYNGKLFEAYGRIKQERDLL